MIVEQKRSDLLDAVFSNSLPKASDWVAVCLLVPNKLRPRDMSVQEYDILVFGGKQIIASLNNGYYTRMGGEAYFGVTHGNPGDVKHSLETALKKAAEIHKINEAWKFDVARIGNHHPKDVFREMEWRLFKGYPREWDVFESD